MKRALSLLMALVLCLSLCACGDGGTDPVTVLDPVTGLAYEVNADGKTCTITGIGSCKDAAVNIPETIKDYKVTDIGSNAFLECTGITSITIPDSVTIIPYGAFQGCTSLTSITIPDSVIIIYACAFKGCTDLTSITIPDSVTGIGDGAFGGCTSLTEIIAGANHPSFFSLDGVLYAKDGTTLLLYPAGKTDVSFSIPDSVTFIRNGAFYGCTGLTSITIPDSVTSIGNGAFYGCSSLTSIIIPDSVTSIGYNAFSGCSSLASITIPDSVTSIGWDAFSGTAYYNEESNWVDGVLYIDHCLISASENIPASYTIKDGTKIIADWAFSDGILFMPVIPDTMTSNTEEAPSNYSHILTSIVIPDSVTSIGEFAFRGCSSLTSVTIPDSVTSIGGNAFSECTSLADITIPDSVTYIGWYAFDGCTGLTSITIPDSVTSIHFGVLQGCSSLTDIHFAGTKEQWDAIEKDSNWDDGTGEYTVYCTDGEISKN